MEKMRKQIRILLWIIVACYFIAFILMIFARFFYSLSGVSGANIGIVFVGFGMVLGIITIILTEKYSKLKNKNNKI